MSDVEKQHHNHDASYDPTYGTGPTLGAPASVQARLQGVAPLQFRKFANPAPLGLMSFASTTLILSLINLQTDKVDTPNIVVGMAMGVGGLAQLLAGMWEFAAGNTLGATAFSSYGGFWLSYAAILIPGSGILEAYASNGQAGHAIGFYLASWFIFTFLMLIASLRSNVTLISLFFFLMMTFMMLTIAEFVENVKITKAGGGLGVITAFIAYYAGLSNMLTPDTAFFSLPLIPVKKD